MIMYMCAAQTSTVRFYICDYYSVREALALLCLVRAGLQWGFLFSLSMACGGEQSAYWLHDTSHLMRGLAGANVVMHNIFYALNLHYCTTKDNTMFVFHKKKKPIS